MAIPYAPYLIQNWFTQTTYQTLQTRDNILQVEDFSQTSQEIITFAIISALLCKPELTHRILEKLFKLPETTTAPNEQLPLELIWRSFPAAGRPENTPWSPWDEAKYKSFAPESDPESVAFYESWTSTEWIMEMQGLKIDDKYDVHRWKESTDPWSCAIAARVLCKPRNGNVATRERLEEALAAMDKLFTQLPPRGDNMPHGHILPLQVYSIMATYLGHPEKARASLKIACQQPDSELHNFVDIPLTWDFLAASIDNPPIAILDVPQLEEISNELCTALDTRHSQGYKKPLSDLPIPELLSRFSKAAFFVHQDEYTQNEISTPKEILHPPITAAEITEIEEKIGPLPTDVKEIALVADGFRGGWHFAGGGWPGIKKFEPTRALDYELYLGIEPESSTIVETRTREDGTTYEVTQHTISIGGSTEEDGKRNWGDVFVAWPENECDDFEHVLCPERVWARYQQERGEKVKDGEYGYCHFAHWTDGPDEVYGSVREWIADMTVGLERQVEMGEREQGPAAE